MMQIKLWSNNQETIGSWGGFFVVTALLAFDKTRSRFLPVQHTKHKHQEAKGTFSNRGDQCPCARSRVWHFMCQEWRASSDYEYLGNTTLTFINGVYDIELFINEVIKCLRTDFSVGQKWRWFKRSLKCKMWETLRAFFIINSLAARYFEQTRQLVLYTDTAIASRV